jgi:outer membrane lipoprotein-sorting protein
VVYSAYRYTGEYDVIPKSPLIVLIFGLWLALPASAAPSQVQRYFQDLRSLRADFIQRVFDERSQIVQSSSGQMLMQKPGKFRWNYRRPPSKSSSPTVIGCGLTMSIWRK